MYIDIMMTFPLYEYVLLKNNKSSDARIPFHLFPPEIACR